VSPRRAAVVLSLAALLVLGWAPPARAAVSAQVVKSGLAFPAAFTIASDGRIFYGERFSGEIRIFDPATNQDTLFFTVPSVATAGEQGLLGLALPPRYPRTAAVYAFYTRTVGGVPQNQIVRIRDNGGVGSAMKTVFSTTAATNHNGGAIHFGPDKMLYAVVGENGNPASAQNTALDIGKVLRMTASGKVPTNNPFPGEYAYAYGLRNSFGFAFDPSTRRLWLDDNGAECNDEVHRVDPGANLGWGPNATCSTPPPAPQNTNQDGPNPVQPLLFYTPTIAPTGAAFCQGCGLGTDTEGTFLFGSFNDGAIRRVTLTTDRLGVVSQTILYDHSSFVLAVERGPDGKIYFSDGGAIYRLIP
jgi:glucose/arabinose dehydrogenase